MYSYRLPVPQLFVIMGVLSYRGVMIDDVLVRLTVTVTVTVTVAWIWMMVVGHESKSNCNTSRVDNTAHAMVVVAVGTMIPKDLLLIYHRNLHRRRRLLPPWLPSLVAVILYYHCIPVVVAGSLV
jgi:hypothetical protein